MVGDSFKICWGDECYDVVVWYTRTEERGDYWNPSFSSIELEIESINEDPDHPLKNDGDFITLVEEEIDWRGH